MPRWIWFYAAKPADRGGETVLCDGRLVFSELSGAGKSFLANDVLYWWRASSRSGESGLAMRDPLWIERNFRGPVVGKSGTFSEISARCQPLLCDRSGKRTIFGNHILNTIEHDDDGGPPQIDGFHRVRTPDRQPLPESFLGELKGVTQDLQFCVNLELDDLLWVDNTRFLHGREAFEGSRCIVVRKSYDADQVSF
jgi:hypothetical protein